MPHSIIIIIKYCRTPTRQASARQTTIDRSMRKCRVRHSENALVGTARGRSHNNDAILFGKTATYAIPFLQSSLSTRRLWLIAVMAACTCVARVLAVVVLVTAQMVVGRNKAADSATENSNDNEQLRELLGTLENYQVSLCAAFNVCLLSGQSRHTTATAVPAMVVCRPTVS